MEIKTFADLIDWTRQLHAHLARCLHDSAGQHKDERASALLDYISSHETLLEKAVAEYENQADPKAMQTRLYDYGVHNPSKKTGPAAPITQRWTSPALPGRSLIFMTRSWRSTTA